MTFKLVKAVKVRALPGHRLDVTFSDGSAGIADLKALVTAPGPMVEPLRDEAFFGRVFLEMGVPTWPNGFDVDPTNLLMGLEAAGHLRSEDAAA